MRLVMLGGTGSGKGTQTAKICDRLKILNISTGDMLRAGIASETEPLVNKLKSMSLKVN